MPHCWICGRKIHLGDDHAKIAQGGIIHWYCKKHYGLLEEIALDLSTANARLMEAIHELEKAKELFAEIKLRLNRRRKGRGSDVNDMTTAFPVAGKAPPAGNPSPAGSGRT